MAEAEAAGMTRTPQNRFSQCEQGGSRDAATVTHNRTPSICADEYAEHIRRGNRRAFRSLFKEEYEGLCRFAASYVGSVTAAEDLIQEVFLDLWRRRDDFDASYPIRAYLYGAARNQALKYLRQKKARHYTEGGEGQDAPSRHNTEDGVRERELQEAAQSALSALPERRRLIFELSRRQDLTYAEIAALLGISVKTVETQMGRALRSLRESLHAFLSLLA